MLVPFSLIKKSTPCSECFKEKIGIMYLENTTENKEFIRIDLLIYQSIVAYSSAIL